MFSVLHIFSIQSIKLCHFHIGNIECTRFYDWISPTLINLGHQSKYRHQENSKASAPELVISPISPDIHDPLSLPLPIVHCFRQVLRATSCIGTYLLYVGSSWSSFLCTSMWRGPQKYITYELLPTSPAVSRMSGLSNFDSFRDGW